MEHVAQILFIWLLLGGLAGVLFGAFIRSGDVDP